MNSLEQSLFAQLTKLVAFKPVTADKACANLLKYVETELNQLNMQTRLVEHNGIYSLLGGTSSTASSRILLQAHIDVVPASKDLFTLKQQGNTARGRGAYDMLFATASYLVLLKDLHARNQLQNLDIGIMLTSDEEVGGFNGVGKLIEDYTCLVCFLPDAGGYKMLNARAKGVLQIEISAAGKGGHAGRPSECDNPISKIARIIDTLELEYTNRDPQDTVCSITSLSAGEALNQVPNSATVCLDIRYVPEDNPALIIRAIEKLVQPFSAKVTQLVCEPAYTVDITSPLVSIFIKTYEAFVGGSIQTIQAPGSSDARFFSAKNIPVIMIRPLGGGLHAPDEWISMDSLGQFHTILREYVIKVGTIES